jgi:predicted neutral ceramidase superfamily lipid hydrolase
MWQDYAIGIISILFTLELIPQLVASLKGRAKTSFITAFSTGVCLLLLGFIYSTLGLVFSSFLSVITALVWFTLWFAGREVKCSK